VWLRNIQQVGHGGLVPDSSSLSGRPRRGDACEGMLESFDLGQHLEELGLIFQEGADKMQIL